MKLFGLGRPFLHGLEIRENEFRVHHFDIADRIDRPKIMSDIFVLEATNGMRNGIHGPDVLQELVPQPFAFTGSPDETRNIEELKRRGGNLFGMNQLRQALQPFIGHRNNANVRINRTEPIVRHLRPDRRKGIEDRRFSNIGKTYDSAAKAHGPSGENEQQIPKFEFLFFCGFLALYLYNKNKIK
jgi:hypothetical protein